jgi:hypothetical protein
MEAEIKGSKFTIVHCRNAVDSWSESISHLQKAKAKSMLRQMTLQLCRLADGQRMSKENCPQEGSLPPVNGNKSSFYAMKRIPIRGYFWHSQAKELTIFVSHYIYKDHGKLRQKDTDRVCNNWRRVEEDGNDH